MSNKTIRSTVLAAIAVLGLCGQARAADDQVQVVSKSDLKAFWQSDPAYQNSPPQYPIEALRNGVEGCVAVAFEIHPDGTASNERVWHSSLPKGWTISKQMEQSTLLAAHQWRYVPASSNTARIPVYTYTVETFHMGGSIDKLSSQCEMSDFPRQVQAMINAAASAKGATQ